MNSVLKGLREYVGDDKQLVDYLYVLLKMFDKYGKSLYNYIDNIKLVDTKLGDILEFFKEENYNRKDIYTLLENAISETGYNIYEIKKTDDIPDDVVKLENSADIVEDKLNDDIGIAVKSADSKIYKRFALDDVKKILNLN